MKEKIEAVIADAINTFCKSLSFSSCVEVLDDRIIFHLFFKINREKLIEEIKSESGK